MSLDAVTGDVVVPGLGIVHGASFYQLRRGSAERSTPGGASLMPPVLQIEKGSSFELHLHNYLTTIDAAPAGQPAPRPVPDATNVHTHGLVVPPTGLGFGTSHPRLGDCVLPLAAGAHAGMHEAHGMPVSVLSVDPFFQAEIAHPERAMAGDILQCALVDLLLLGRASPSRIIERGSQPASEE